MKFIAKHNYVRSSAQKIRLVARLIKKKKVVYALNVLNFSNKKASFIIKKVLKSAISNAENNSFVDIDDLVISSILIDVASSMKRVFPRAKGRADRLLKRNCHITVILSKI